MNERKEQKAINEYLLLNLTRVNLHGQPTHSTNKSKENYHHKRRTSSPNDEGWEEHTHDLLEEEYHISSSDDSPSPCKKRHKNDDILQGEFQKMKKGSWVWVNTLIT